MKTYTITKIAILTLILTASGIAFGEVLPPPPHEVPGFEHVPCPEEVRERGRFRGRPEAHKRMEETRWRRKHAGEMRRRGAEAMEWLKEKDPEKFEKLVELRQSGGRDFFKEMRGVMKEFMKEKNPEMFKMHEQNKKNRQNIKNLADKLKEAETTEEKVELEAKLKEALGKQFDFKQKLKTKELLKLENRIKKMKESLDARQKNKESMVEMAFKGITEGKEAIEW